MKRLVLLIIFLVIAILLFNTLTRKKQKHYPTKENCEDAEKKICRFSQCDYKCENSTYGYFKGYIPTESSIK